MLLFGEIAVELGLITVTQLRRALTRQNEMLRRGEHKLIGVIMVEMGFILTPDIDRILRRAEEEKAKLSPEEEAETLPLSATG